MRRLSVALLVVAAVFAAAAPVSVTAGVVLSVLLGMAINAGLLDDPLAFTGEAAFYLTLGFLFGTLAAFPSGIYPAWKAANARPVEALRD